MIAVFFKRLYLLSSSRHGHAVLHAVLHAPLGTPAALPHIHSYTRKVAGSLAMAAGEYVSVSQQADTEKADVEKERQAQLAGPEARSHEQRELEVIWQARGLSEDVAKMVAQQLTDHDVVRAHARDELGIDIDDHPNAVQAALASAVRSGAYALHGCRCLFFVLGALFAAALFVDSWPPPASC
jgi:VIT1/CCC1 family predicted Fe2+/Mn2+ transporter